MGLRTSAQVQLMLLGSTGIVQYLLLRAVDEIVITGYDNVQWNLKLLQFYFCLTFCLTTFDRFF